MTIVTTALNAVSDAAAGDCYPLLLAEVRKLATSIGNARLLVNLLPDDPAAPRWRRLGFRPGSVMARRPVATWRSPDPPPPGVAVRVARPDDVEALTDLALEEHHCHAEHTTSGVGPDQPRDTSRWIGLSTGITGDLPAAGQLVLIVLMFVGRVGTITVASALALQAVRRRYRFPEERPIVG